MLFVREEPQYFLSLIQSLLEKTISCSRMIDLYNAIYLSFLYFQGVCIVFYPFLTVAFLESTQVPGVLIILKLSYVVL